MVKKYFEFEVFYDGIYAIIFTPNLEDSLYRDEVFCGVLCKDKRLVFIFTLVILPIMTLFFFVAYKM